MIELTDAPKVVAPQEEYEGGAVAAGGAADKAMQKLEDIGDAVADVCRSIQKKVIGALQAAAPDELTLEFGIVLTGETGIPMLTKASAEATLKVSTTWKKNGADGG